jgi:hypothetical protein
MAEKEFEKALDCVSLCCRINHTNKTKGYKMKSWDVYRKCGIFWVWCDRVYFQPNMTGEDVHASIEDDYDYPVIVKPDDINEAE